MLDEAESPLLSHNGSLSAFRSFSEVVDVHRLQFQLTTAHIASLPHRRGASVLLIILKDQ
jgi:hypothetical protein